MKFRDFFSVKHILFAVVLMALMLGFAVRQSNKTVKVFFDEDAVYINSAKYSLEVPYDIIASAELMALPEAGERIANCYDDGTLLAGNWSNDTWGEYHIVADPDAKNCIAMTLDDGRIFVISRKNDAATEEDFQKLLQYLN